MKNIEWYPSEDNALLLDFIKELKKKNDNQNYDNLKRIIEQLEIHGFELEKISKGSIKKMGNKLWELRYFDVRILFTHHKEKQIFYILQGFLKDSQKTPQKIIKQARKYVKEIQRN
ncbi:MAG: type II toxin-antitoxin system RelE/ParE family toxin [Acholeplasmataceae bacterium]